MSRHISHTKIQHLRPPSLVTDTPATLLGRSINTYAYMPTMVTEAKAIAFDVSIADRQSRSFKRLNELYAANGQVDFLDSQRVDGKLILPKTIKVLQLVLTFPAL